MKHLKLAFAALPAAAILSACGGGSGPTISLSVPQAATPTDPCASSNPPAYCLAGSGGSTTTTTGSPSAPPPTGSTPTGSPTPTASLSIDYGVLSTGANAYLVRPFDLLSMNGSAPVQWAIVATTPSGATDTAAPTPYWMNPQTDPTMSWYGWVYSPPGDSVNVALADSATGTPEGTYNLQMADPMANLANVRSGGTATTTGQAASHAWQVNYSYNNGGGLVSGTCSWQVSIAGVISGTCQDPVNGSYPISGSDSWAATTSAASGGNATCTSPSYNGEAESCGLFGTNYTISAFSGAMFAGGGSYTPPSASVPGASTGTASSTEMFPQAQPAWSFTASYTSSTPAVQNVSGLSGAIASTTLIQNCASNYAANPPVACATSPVIGSWTAIPQ